MILPNNRAVCPKCKSRIVVILGGGECPKCGNEYDYYFNGCMKYLAWGYREKEEGKTNEPEKFGVIEDSKREFCPDCSKEYQKVVIKSDRYLIIQKTCPCGKVDNEVIKK
jgi:hypothetical protein